MRDILECRIVPINHNYQTNQRTGELFYIENGKVICIQTRFSIQLKNKKGYITNPKTGRSIQINGSVYKKLDTILKNMITYITNQMFYKTFVNPSIIIYEKSKGKIHYLSIFLTKRFLISKNVDKNVIIYYIFAYLSENIKTCCHVCQNFSNTCCWCSDKRTNKYEHTIYKDGIGNVVEKCNIDKYYCGICKSSS